MSGPPGGGMPPWMTPERQKKVTPRNGDIWISVPVKSGTNWMMNIVHQLLTGGDASFDTIYGVVSWPEFTERPGQPLEEVVDRIEALPTDRRRLFKSHTPPPDCPYQKPGTGKDVKYIVVCRNPEEALVSFKVFLERHTDEFYGMWGIPKAALTRPDFPTFYREVVDQEGMQGMLFGFVASWWPFRSEPNVLMLHFSDLKKDLSGNLRKVARFLDIEPSDEEWKKIEEHSTFDWMRANQAKFEIHPYTPVSMLEPGAMIRKGKAGAAREDGMTDEVSKHLRGVGSKIITDADTLRWFYEGGPLP